MVMGFAQLRDGHGLRGDQRIGAPGVAQFNYARCWVVVLEPVHVTADNVEFVGQWFV